MSPRLLGDLVPALLFAALGAWVFREMERAQDAFSIGTGMDGAGYPRALAIATIVLAAALALRPLARRAFGRLEAADVTAEDLAMGVRDTAPPRVWRPLAAAGLFAAYTLALDPLGFLIATIPLLTAVMLLAGARSLVTALLVATGLTVAVQAIVFHAFSIVLPEGPWRQLYG